MNNVEIPFAHTHAAHCESGVISSLLRHSGLEMSEAMAFGISGALTFAYIPLVKIGGMPLIGYRMPPRHIIKKLSKRLGIGLHTETFSSPEAGAAALDKHLMSQQPVGLQTSVFWLPYFPRELRFHFNAHNIVAYGKSGNDYLISDPTIEMPVRCDSESLERARFVKGVMQPKGLIYRPSNVPTDIDLRQPILDAIKGNMKMMLKTPVPIAGIRGIRRMSRIVRDLDAKQGKTNTEQQTHANKLYLGHIVRMQEEIGTGGAGFRFLYASFLQEAAVIVERPELHDIAAQLTATGDEWRQFALHAAKMCKGRMDLDYQQLADQLLVCADSEHAVFSRLAEAVA